MRSLFVSIRALTSTLSICRTHERPMFTDAERRSGFLCGQPWAGTAEKAGAYQKCCNECYAMLGGGYTGVFRAFFDLVHCFALNRRWTSKWIKSSLDACTRLLKLMDH